MKLFMSLMVLFMMVSCGTIKKSAVNATSSILYDGTYEIETDGNWESFKKGLPGNIKFVEGLLYISPDSEKLLASLIKAHSSYAFVVYETMLLDDLLSDSGSRYNLDQTLYHYSKAIAYGERLLGLYNLKYSDLINRVNSNTDLVSFLNNKLPSDNYILEAIAFMAQSMAGIINLQKHKVMMVAQLPVTKALFDWVCIQKPDVNYGACDIFYGAYESGRPKTLGGNPKKGKKHFLSAIKKWPSNWLARVAYIQYYIIPMFLEREYKEQSFVLDQATKAHYNEMMWKPGEKKNKLDFKEKHLRIYQALAIKRFEIIKKYEKELF